MLEHIERTDSTRSQPARTTGGDKGRVVGSRVARPARLARMVVGPADDPLEREADAVADRVVASARAPFTSASADSSTRIRLRSEPGSAARTIRRSLATIADDAAGDAVTAHLEQVQDTGRTFMKELELLYRINELRDKPDTDLAKKFAGVVKNKGGDTVVLRTAINTLAATVNPMVPTLMAELSTARDTYSDISDALRSHFSGNQMVVGLDEKLLESSASQIRQAVFKEDPLQFVTAIGNFKKWVKNENYGYVYDEFVQSHAEEALKEAALDKGPAEVVATPGVVTLAQMRTVAPNGLTAGQRYTPDKKYGSFRYHVSISFKVIDTKANLKASPAKKQVDIEQFHVSFEPDAGGPKTYYWWKKTGKAKYVFDKAAGPPGTEGMKTKATEAVAAAAPKVNCTV